MFPAVSDSKLDSKFQEELTPEVLLIADKCVQLIQDTNTSQPDDPFDWFIKNMGFTSKHRQPHKDSSICFYFRIVRNLKVAGEITFGFQFANWFLSFTPAGKVVCETSRNISNDLIYHERVALFSDDEIILEVLKKLLSYRWACDHTKYFDEKKFNGAHFVSYGLQYLGLYDALTFISKKYLETYMESQRFPCMLRVSKEFQELDKFDDICKNNQVQKEILPKGQFLLTAESWAKFDKLYCELIEEWPALTIHSSDDVRGSMEIVRLMITQAGNSFAMPQSTWPNDCPLLCRFNWAGYNNLKENLKEWFSADKPLINESIDTEDKPIYIKQNSFFEQAPNLSNEVLPVQELFNNFNKL